MKQTSKVQLHLHKWESQALYVSVKPLLVYELGPVVCVVLLLVFQNHLVLWLFGSCDALRDIKWTQNFPPASQPKTSGAEERL